MNAHERQDLLIRALLTESPLSVLELEAKLGASPATIRRDLAFLEKAGKIVRTHGSVYHPDHFSGEASFDRKSRRALEVKVRLARMAAELVQAGANVFIDAGTTTLEIGRLLLQREGLENITIFTNSLPLLSERSVNGVRVVSLGGEVRQVSLALTGPVALEWIRRLRFDLAFMGASGLDATEGATTTELSEATVKSAILARAKRTVLLVDAAKWEAPAAIRYADWSQINDVFTDYHPSSEEVARLAKHGTTLHIYEARPS